MPLPPWAVLPPFRGAWGAKQIYGGLGGKTVKEAEVKKHSSQKGEPAQKQ